MTPTSAANYTLLTWARTHSERINRVIALNTTLERRRKKKIDVSWHLHHHFNSTVSDNDAHLRRYIKWRFWNLYYVLTRLTNVSIVCYITLDDHSAVFIVIQSYFQSKTLLTILCPRIHHHIIIHSTHLLQIHQQQTCLRLFLSTLLIYLQSHRPMPSLIEIWLQTATLTKTILQIYLQIQFIHL